MDFPEIFKYQVDRNAPPTGESVEKINEEAHPEDYHGPREEGRDKSTFLPSVPM
jgi:hypothetical protein